MSSYLPLSKPMIGEMATTNSDTMSEISESGTATSGWASRWDSREDLRNLASKLGLNDVSDLYQERFKVNRPKLEKMLTCDNEAFCPADVFFAKVMEDTDTIITWPSKLRIDAKSKKDPHVRIAGRPEDVKAARDRILSVLDTVCKRVTMKMDVSYTDHSHIIGKGGLTIKGVLEQTKCHVHFPDSNQTNPMEKSNQVSITGDIEGVEMARSRVRELIPLIFGFELPIKSQNVDISSPFIQKIQEEYGVLVMFKKRPKLHAIMVLVKGVEWEVHKVKTATLLLMDYLCESLASQTLLQMSLEISPHHHPVVLAKNHSNIKAIMEHTGCQIMFPDAQDPNTPTLKKSNVIITGNIHKIYDARQLLIGSLPLMIIFDLPDDHIDLRIKIQEIETSCDVSIKIKQKANKSKACVIKGIERLVSNVYKARNLILGLNEPPVQSFIPYSYHLPNAAPPQLNHLTSTNSNPTALVSPLISPSWPIFPSPTAPPHPQPQNTPFSAFLNVNQQQQIFFPPNINPNALLQQSMGHSGYQPFKSSQHDQTITQKDEANTSTCSSISTISSTRSPTNHSPNSYYTDPSQPYDPRNLGTALSPVFSQMNSSTLMDNKQSPTGLGAYELENKRLAAMRAMRAKPKPGILRVPHNIWSGCGMSNTSPGGFLADKYNTAEDDIWQATSPRTFATEYSSFPSSSASMMNTSNVLEHTPTHVWNRFTSNSDWQDLPTLLTVMNLEHYIPLFKKHEIDLGLFSTLTDQDLIHIGISALGARKRMVLAITEINKKNSPFSAAPGAERRQSLSNSQNGN
ncbi:protein bicaudal C-like isoform X2 [Anthonomus grandis grandis]|uniref:protein bicaudal C-like isoform X2 n=1 Tax=Anthonomus grandis grandis TaxID=2921223 RepID=UPI0021664610|nr:protein bicaudal C-like isoform X2 [Anthonomus grandis grandis]